MPKKYKIDDRKISYRVIDGEAIILNLHNGYYYSLNDTGTRIWELLNKKHSTEKILEFLQKEYEVSHEVLKRDLEEVLSDLKKEEILEVV